MVSESKCQEYLRREEVEDPLAVLYQLDDIECNPEERRALVLVTRLLQNIEEYYELQGQIKDAMTRDSIVRDRVKSFMSALIRGLLTENKILSKEFSKLDSF